MNEKDSMPWVPLGGGLKAGTGQTVNITRDAGGNIYSLTFPDSNAEGYLINDGAGNLDWTQALQGPPGPQGISGTGGGGTGQISFSTGTDAVFNLATGVPILINPATSLINTNAGIFTTPAAGQIQYIATGSKYYKILVTLSGHTTHSNSIIKYHIYKNGTTSLFNIKQHHNNQEFEIVCMSFAALLNQNDYIEVRLESDGDYAYHLGSMILMLDPC